MVFGFPNVKDKGGNTFSCQQKVPAELYQPKHESTGIDGLISYNECMNMHVSVPSGPGDKLEVTLNAVSPPRGVSLEDVNSLVTGDRIMVTKGFTDSAGNVHAAN